MASDFKSWMRRLALNGWGTIKIRRRVSGRRYVLGTNARLVCSQGSSKAVARQDGRVLWSYASSRRGSMPETFGQRELQSEPSGLISKRHVGGQQLRQRGSMAVDKAGKPRQIRGARI